MQAVTEILVDMISNRTYCGCCDNATEHACLIERTLQRIPVELWPAADACFGPDCDERKGIQSPYKVVYEALVERKEWR